MNCILMSALVGHDSPDLARPLGVTLKLEAIRAFEAIRTPYVLAETHYDTYAASLTPYERMVLPTDIANRIARLEAVYERHIVPMAEAEAEAIEGMKAIGIGVNFGGVTVDGSLYLVVEDPEATQPTIVVVNLADVEDL